MVVPLSLFFCDKVAFLYRFQNGQFFIRGKRCDMLQVWGLPSGKQLELCPQQWPSVLFLHRAYPRNHLQLRRVQCQCTSQFSFDVVAINYFLQFAQKNAPSCPLAPLHSFFQPVLGPGMQGGRSASITTSKHVVYYRDGSRSDGYYCVRCFLMYAPIKLINSAESALIHNQVAWSYPSTVERDGRIVNTGF